MADGWFLGRLSRRGRIAYVVGQILLLALLVAVLFGLMGYTLETGQTELILGAAGTVVAWGLLCMIVWPRNDEYGSDDTTD